MAQNIRQPHGGQISNGSMTVRLSWAQNFSTRWNGVLQRKQQIVDSEVLRYCAPYVPFRTGALTRSGTVGTVIGSGEVVYASPYARFQYYATAESREYDPRRGGLWFERMKPAHKADILRAAERG